MEQEAATYKRHENPGGWWAQKIAGTRPEDKLPERYTARARKARYNLSNQGE